MQLKLCISLFVAVFVVSAGCLSHASGPPSTHASSTSTGSKSVSSESLAPPLNRTNQTLPPTFRATDCFAWGANFQDAGPDPTFQRPSGWNAPNPDLGPVIFDFVYECQRVSLGPFERGPMTFLIEETDYFAQPDSCTSPHGTDFNYLLYLLLFDDPQFASYLHDSWGMPAQHANFTKGDITAPDGKLRRWDWSVDGGGHSWMILPDPDQELGSSGTLQFHTFWFNQTTLWSMQRSETSAPDQASGPLAPSHFEAPNLWAKTGRPATVGLAGTERNMTIDGPITQYKDWVCTPASNS